VVRILDVILVVEWAKEGRYDNLDSNDDDGSSNISHLQYEL